MSFHVHVRRAVTILGGQAKLAAAINRAQSEVSRLCSSAQSISPDVAVAISRATGGQVLIADLLPEVTEAVREELSRQAAAPAPEACAT